MCSSPCLTSLLLVLLFVFFFSSRRRHTRSKRDWSSDVCSSDLRAASTRPLWPVVVATQRTGYLALSALALDDPEPVGTITLQRRSEERRVGKEWRCRWAR